jgi:uncharacterized protein (DUF362 family)
MVLEREKVAVEELKDYKESIERALDSIGARDRLPQSGLIILKPNLTNSDAPPVTTDIRTVRAVLGYCRKHSQAEVVIGEGCGSGVTSDSFKANGYTELAAELNLELIDFNEEDDVKLENVGAKTWKELYMPKVALNAFVISIPVLKDHCFTETNLLRTGQYSMYAFTRNRIFPWSTARRR